jgi:hypothetical protein
MTHDAPKLLHAGPEHIGRFCTVCGRAITEYQMIQIPGPGRAPIHRACWEEHGETPQPADSADAPSASQATAARPTTPRITESIMPKVYLLFLAALATLLGPMIGLAVGFFWMGEGNSPVRRRDGKELLIFSAVMFVLQLIMVMLMIAGVVEVFRSGALDRGAVFPRLP